MHHFLTMLLKCFPGPPVATKHHSNVSSLLSMWPVGVNSESIFKLMNIHNSSAVQIFRLNYQSIREEETVSQGLGFFPSLCVSLWLFIGTGSDICSGP
jgi:hypothetical protein